jgi:hypothetical protein
MLLTMTFFHQNKIKKNEKENTIYHDHEGKLFSK